MCVILKLVVFLITLKLSVQNYTYHTNFVEVPVDHFSFTNNHTFKLRYLLNDTYWYTDGPIFFYAGNEGNINMFAQNTGFMWEIAQEFKALLVFAEHRYYGESMPYGNQSFTDLKYLGYLTSTQALADYVYLIDHIQETKLYYTHTGKSPVIAFGGSYGGMLAAWLRMKYPSSVRGAIASSAPIYQFHDLTPCEAYNKLVTTDFKIASQNDCTISIKKSWHVLREITATDDGKAWITENWKICKPLKTTQDIDNLVNWLEGTYGDLAMLNYPYPTDFLKTLPAYPVKVVCSKLQDNSLNGKPLLEAIWKALSVYTNYTGTTTCVNIGEVSSNGFGYQGWDFQTCTEMIMPKCSDKVDMFEEQTWNFTKHSLDCYKKWGVKMSRSDVPVLEYGGKNLNAASNIVFSNGLLDPWCGGGVLHNISNTVLVVLIPDGAHHLDLRASNLADPLSVVQARNFHRHVIHQWLQVFYKTEFGRYD